MTTTPFPNDPSELQELSLPAPGLTKSNAVEQQFDFIVDLLASQRTHAAEVPSWARSDQLASEEGADVELSIVMPCLDEADTVGTCILKAVYSLEQMGITGEVIVADNGSRDDSIEIAESLGARVVHVDEPGYGAALMGGIEAARGKYIIMGDADDSYDFSQCRLFYEKLKAGADLVQGCRLKGGGGRVMPGAMPWLHHFGNPALTWLVQSMFGARINDVYCGLRGFTKAHYQKLDQRCTGMEFATEMIIKSSLFGANISEVPITLHPDGRKSHKPHLRTFRDGWRTLRFFLLLSPRWAFGVPGILLACAGALGMILVYGGVSIAGATFDAHTLLLSVVALLISTQLGTFAVLAKSFAASERLLPEDPRVERFARILSLERSLWGSAGLILSGAAVVAWKSCGWAASGFGELDYSATMRWIIPAVGAIALGVQSAFGSFMLSVIRMARR
jgi:hypothetical protein